MRRFIGRLLGIVKLYFDDILILTGFACILVGTWHVCPVATWFVAGAGLIGFGVLVGLSGRS